MKGKIYSWSLTVAIAGFLFGFDTAVISGAEQPIQKLWSLSDLVHGLAVGMALWGTVVGALLGGIPTDRFGRKRTLFWIGVLFLISAVGSALSFDPYTFMLFRFIGGLAVGASSVAAPTYISEISPPEKRGRMVILYQVMLVSGILIAYVSNYLLGGIGGNAWRWMLGIEALPALVYILMVLRIPESPRWLIVKKGLKEEGKKILQMINPAKVEESYQAILADAGKSKNAGLFSGKYSLPLMLAFLLAFFNQASGINAIIYYAPRVFELTGLGESTALLSTAGVGIVNVVFTLLGLYLIDRSGRKRLMIIGSIGYIVSLVLVSRAFFFDAYTGVPIFIFLFIASHAIGQGAVIWVFISEIFPNKVRANGQAWGSGTHWVFAAMISSLFPFFVGKFSGGPIFAFFAGMMILQFIWAIFMMPETKGKSLEELENLMTKDA